MRIIHGIQVAPVLLVLLLTGCCCCGGSQQFQQALQQGMEQAAKHVESVANVTKLTVTVKAKADANGGVWPESLEDVRADVIEFDTTMTNPNTGDNPGYEYVKPADGSDPATTIVIYQLRDGARDEALESGFADGSVHTPRTAAATP